MDNCDIYEIGKYTVALYREKYSQPTHVGSGILMRIQDKYYLVSAYHVFDMEEERLRIENDPDEEGIPQDDMDGIMARTVEGYFCINSKMTGVVFTAKYDPIKEQAVFNEDTEWCSCELTTEIANIFIQDGKSFYDVDLIDYLEKDIQEDEINMVISGFPQYAQNKDGVKYRSFKVVNIITGQSYDKSLIRVGFVNNKAFNYEQNRDIELPTCGIAGMSGGGIWAFKDEKYIPVGIILKQDPTENYVEGFRMDCILKSITENKKKNK